VQNSLRKTGRGTLTVSVRFMFAYDSLLNALGKQITADFRQRVLSAMSATVLMKNSHSQLSLAV